MGNTKGKVAEMNVGSTYSQPSDTRERYPKSCFKTKETVCVHTSPKREVNGNTLFFSSGWSSSSDGDSTLLNGNNTSDSSL